MHKGGRNEHACAKVSRKEERIAGDGQIREAADDDGKGAGGGAQDEDEEEGEDV